VAASSPGLGSFGAFLAFVLLVVPGLVFELLRERHRPPHGRTSFREVSTTALASLIFSGIASLILFGVGQVVSGWLPDLTPLAQDPSRYVSDHVHLVFRAAVIEVVLACVLAAGTNWYLGREDGPATIRPNEALWLAFHEGVPKNLVPWAELNLDTGVIYRARVGFIDQTGSDDGRRIVLVPPILRREPGGAVIRVNWSRAVLPLAKVVELHLGFEELSSS